MLCFVSDEYSASVLSEVFIKTVGVFNLKKPLKAFTAELVMIYLLYHIDFDCIFILENYEQSKRIY